MKIIPGEFSKISWKCFLIAKNKAYNSKHQNIDSEHLLLSILQNVDWVGYLLKKLNIHPGDIEVELNNLINKKGKMSSKQERLFIGYGLEKVFNKALEKKKNYLK